MQDDDDTGFREMMIADDLDRLRQRYTSALQRHWSRQDRSSANELLELQIAIACKELDLDACCTI